MYAYTDAISQVDTRLADSTVKPIYSTLDQSTPTFVKSATCWAKDFDWTGMTVSVAGSGAHCGTALTSDIIVTAGHFAIGPGVTLRFVDADGQVVSRTTGNMAYLNTSDQIVVSTNGFTTNQKTDITAVKLTSALPSNVKKYPILPANWATWFPDSGEDLPVIFSDIYKQSLAGELTSFAAANGTQTEVQFSTPSTGSSDRAAVSKNPGAAGAQDSGHPAFLALDDELVLLGCLHHYVSGNSTSGGVVGSAALSEYRSEITAMITALSGDTGYVTYDLSDYSRRADLVRVLARA